MGTGAGGVDRPKVPNFQGTDPTETSDINGCGDFTASAALRPTSRGGHRVGTRFLPHRKLPLCKCLGSPGGCQRRTKRPGSYLRHPKPGSTPGGQTPAALSGFHGLTDQREYLAHDTGPADDLPLQARERAGHQVTLNGRPDPPGSCLPAPGRRQTNPFPSLSRCSPGCFPATSASYHLRFRVSSDFLAGVFSTHRAPDRWKRLPFDRPRPRTIWL